MPLSLHLAEVAPVAPVVEALPILLALAGLLFAVGLIKLVHGFVHAVYWGVEKGVGWIPFAGKVIKAPVHKIEQRVTHWLGEAELSLDSYIGWCFHNLAHLARKTWAELVGLAHVTWVLAKLLAKHPSWAELRSFATALVHPLRTFQHLERRLIDLYRHRIAAIEHSVVAGVYPRIRAGEAALDHVVEWDIPRLRARERALGREITNLRKWVRAHTRVVATAAFVAATAVALRRLGGGWIRCKNWRRIGKHVCGLPTSLIEDLLGLTFAFLVVVDPVVLAKAAIATEDVMHDLIVKVAELNPEG